MLRTPFVPMSDDEFRQAVRAGSAVPCREGDVLIVSKWRDGPGMDVDVFLKALRAQGSKLTARTYRTDVNIRVVRPTALPAPGGHAMARAPKPSG